MFEMRNDTVLSLAFIGFILIHFILIIRKKFNLFQKIAFSSFYWAITFLFCETSLPIIIRPNIIMFNTASLIPFQSIVNMHSLLDFDAAQVIFPYLIRTNVFSLIISIPIYYSFSILVYNKSIKYRILVSFLICVSLLTIYTILSNLGYTLYGICDTSIFLFSFVGIIIGSALFRITYNSITKYLPHKELDADNII
jgi:hypothetical protein